jgi:hypothetical protein
LTDEYKKYGYLFGSLLLFDAFLATNALPLPNKVIFDE